MQKNAQSHLRKHIAPYEKADLRKSVRQIINTIIPYFIFWYLAYLSLSVHYSLTLVSALIASGFLVRIFIIFHDCCHQSFFKSRRANAILGTFTGILTYFCYDRWRHDHSTHHATSSNLNKRGTGDITILTVNEYIASTKWQRLAYRLYRNPFVMFVLGPLYLVLYSNRFSRKNARRKERMNTWFINAMIVLIAVLLSWAIGWQSFLLVQFPIIYIAAAAGIWLFYVQHQFEDSYFESEEEWDYVKAAIDGSSYYKLPKILQWMTGNIGFHHVHHLSPRVPNYYLEEVHEKTPALQEATTITLRSSLKALRFRLWDEANKRLISFREFKILHPSKI